MGKKPETSISRQARTYKRKLILLYVRVLYTRAACIAAEQRNM